MVSETLFRKDKKKQRHGLESVIPGNAVHTERHPLLEDKFSHHNVSVIIGSEGKYK